MKFDRLIALQVRV